MIPSEAEFLAALRKVAAAFDTLGIDYALGTPSPAVFTAKHAPPATWIWQRR